MKSNNHNSSNNVTIKVWACRDKDLPKYQEVLAELKTLLSVDQVKRIESKGKLLPPSQESIRKTKINQSYMARYMIARTVASEKNIFWQEWFKEGFSLQGRDGYNWSITHTNGVTMVAVVKGMKIGIDIEKLSTKKDVLKIAERYFDEEERALLFASSPYVAEENFFKLWTAKEAHFKFRYLMGKTISFYQSLRTCSLYWQYDYNIWGLKWDRDFFFTLITSKGEQPILDVKIFAEKLF